MTFDYNRIDVASAWHMATVIGSAVNSSARLGLGTGLVWPLLHCLDLILE